MSGLNLHAIVRGAITSVHPDETVTLYQSTGQSNNYGIVTAQYAEPQTVKAQVQSANSADLELVERTSQNTVIMRFYLYASADTPPAPIVRPFARSGDMIRRVDGTWWLVTASPDDFAQVGWHIAGASARRDRRGRQRRWRLFPRRLASKP